jgi:hypothetical protein
MGQVQASGGSGLGLSICKMIVELHGVRAALRMPLCVQAAITVHLCLGGRISVSSTVGEGSEFSVVIPMAACPARLAPSHNLSPLLETRSLASRVAKTPQASAVSGDGGAGLVAFASNGSAPLLAAGSALELVPVASSAAFDDCLKDSAGALGEGGDEGRATAFPLVRGVSRSVLTTVPSPVGAPARPSGAPLVMIGGSAMGARVCSSRLCSLAARAPSCPARMRARSRRQQAQPLRAHYDPAAVRGSQRPTVHHGGARGREGGVAPPPLSARVRARCARRRWWSTSPISVRGRCLISS